MKKKFSEGSISLLIINLIHLCGELPYRSLRIIGVSSESSMTCARRLLKQGYIKLANVKRTRTLLLDNKAYEEYGDHLFANAWEWHNESVKETYRKTDSTNLKAKREAIRRRMRNIYNAEIETFFGVAGAKIFPGEKPDLSKELFMANNYLYYSASELKKYWDVDEARANTNRSFGYLIYGNQYFNIYFMPNKLIKIKSVLEYRAKGRVQRFLNLKSKEYKDTGVPGEMDTTIIMTYKYDILNRILGKYVSGSDDQQQLFYIDETTYKTYYLLPYSRDGATLLTMILKDKETLTNLVLSKKERITQINAQVDCHGIADDGTYILVFFVPDINKLDRFLASIDVSFQRNQGKQFHIICFDFQLETLQVLVKGRAKLTSYKMNVVKEAFEKSILKKEG